MSFWEQQFDNLSDKKKRKGKKKTLVFELSVSYLSTYTKLLLPIRPHTACDYLHPSEIIKTPVSQIIVTIENSQLQRAFCGLGSTWKKKNQEIQKRNFFFIKASWIKIIKKCSPDITISKQQNSHSLNLNLSVLSLRWNLSSSSRVELNAGGLFMGQCSTLLWIAPGWDHRYAGKSAVSLPNHPLIYDCPPAS